MKVMAMEVAGEVPPPYIPPGVPGLVTVTGTLPEVAIAEFGMVAVSLVVPPEVVVIAAPLKFTTALPLKFVPVTTRENGPLLATTLGGFRLETVGIVPGCGGVLDLGPYPPHPTSARVSTRTKGSFINCFSGERFKLLNKF